MFDAAEIAAHIRNWKSVSGATSWLDTGGHHEATMPLDIAGVGIEGLFVRLKSPKTVDGFGFMVQVELQRSGRSTERIERVEWKAEHTNPGNGPEDLRFLHLRSTHHHAFELNFLAETGIMRSGNLPIARLVEPDPESVEAFLATCEELLMIRGLASITRPPFQAELPL